MIVHWAFHIWRGVFQWTDGPRGTAALCVRPGGQICYLTPSEGDWVWPHHVKPCLPVSMQRTHNYSLKLTGHARPISEGPCSQLFVQTQRDVAHAPVYWHHSAEGHDRMVSSRTRRTVGQYSSFSNKLMWLLKALITSMKFVKGQSVICNQNFWPSKFGAIQYKAKLHTWCYETIPRIVRKK